MPSCFVKGHLPDYESKGEDVFDEVGMTILGGERGGAGGTHNRRFVANYGCLPRTCADLWHAILASEHPTFMVEVESFQNKRPLKRYSFEKPPYKPKHLMWALHFLSCYPTENQMNGFARSDEKTVRKWTWLFIEAIASLKSEIVSKKV